MIASATPALASDLLYPGGSILSEGAVGKPVWMIQAQCAGFFGATSNVMTDAGDASGAETAKAQGVAFFRDSVERLMKDRALSKAAATEAVSQAVDSGRAEGFQKIRDGGGFGPRSHWNVARSVCMDVADVYKGIRYR
ncbi:MAG TPA: hypothetical protein PLF78_14585 [Caulobacter sp.]|nr:hypothetical protein [Caulobacter sp.]